MSKTKRTLSQDIDALLPQTQCGLCGYAGCRPYAEALASGSESINKCPPGGITTLRAIGALLDTDPSPYESDMQTKSRPPVLAYIREADCIGCTKCIQACPVDAIVGAGTLMHTVLAQECTGCGLCVEPCPVDCIDLLPVSELTYDPNLARSRSEAKKVRLLNEEHFKLQQYRSKRYLGIDEADKDAKKAYILAAMARVNKVNNNNEC